MKSASSLLKISTWAMVLEKASEAWDGGYVMGGNHWHPETPSLHVIRMAFALVFGTKTTRSSVAASERPVIQTAFNATTAQVHELEPGSALLIGTDGTTEIKQVRPAAQRTPCSFERIYFSRGNDADIYQERMALGESPGSTGS